VGIPATGYRQWTTMGEPIPAKEEVGHAHGCLAKVEDQVGCLLAGEIEAGAVGMAGTVSAVHSTPPELKEEEERGLGIRMGHSRERIRSRSLWATR